MSHHLLDETSAKAFRFAKIRYLIIIGVIIAIICVCIALIIYQQNQKNKFAKIAKEYAEINSLYYQENLQNSNESVDSSSGDKVNHDKSMASFAQFALKHAKEPYGWQAAIRTANYYINQGNLQAAKELFEIIIPHTYNYPLIQMKVGTTLAGIYAELGEEAKSLEQIQYVNQIASNPLPEETGLFYSQILYLFNKTDEARQKLSTLTSEQAKIWLHYIEK